MHTLTEINRKLQEIQSKICDLSDQRILVRRKYIDIHKKNYQWIEVLDTSNINFDYFIFNIWVERSYGVYYNMNSCKKTNYMNLLFSYKLKTYYICFSEDENDNPRRIIIEYLQLPKKININI